MKFITALCAFLWGLMALFNLYDLTLGSYPINESYLETPVDAVQSILWFIADAATAAFFFILSLKQDE